MVIRRYADYGIRCALCTIRFSSSGLLFSDFSSDDPLSKLFLLDANVLLACCLRSGEVWRIDLRCGVDKGECLCSTETTSTGVTDQTCGYWTYDVQKNEECQSPGVFSLAPGGHVAKMDLRNVQKSAFVVKLSEVTSYNSPQDGYGAFKVSPTHKDIVSVSGKFIWGVTTIQL